MVLAAAMRGKTRGRIQIGADDPSLTAAGGMLAVTELCERLGLIAALDEGMGPVKQRRRGFTGGQVLAGMAAAQLAGEDFLVGLDRVRADQAGQLVTPVPGLATSTATGIARRLTQKHWRGAEAGLARATAAMIGLLPAERAAELAEGPVTIDIDATDVEVYGSKKRGVAYNYQGQRRRPHVASWAETEIPLAADLLSGDQDPRSHVVGLLGRALAALPQAVRDGARAAGRRIALRADAGYFAGELARAAAKENMAFAIGAKRITSMWKALAGIAEDAWRDAIDMQNAQVAVSPYKRADWPEDTVLLVRRVKLDPDQVSADPRSRRRRTLHPDQRALPFPELEQEPAIYACSFICTNMDVSTPAKAAAVEHWYRHRTSIENIFRDSKHGAALRHLPSGSNGPAAACPAGHTVATVDTSTVIASSPVELTARLAALADPVRLRIVGVWPAAAGACATCRRRCRWPRTCCPTTCGCCATRAWWPRPAGGAGSTTASTVTGSPLCGRRRPRQACRCPASTSAPRGAGPRAMRRSGDQRQDRRDRRCGGRRG